MRRTLSLIVAIASLSASTLCEQGIAGNWRRPLNVGANLPFIHYALPRTELQGASKNTVWRRDPSAQFKSTFIPVDKDVKLQVIDWGGSGRPLVLLAGLGASAHAFDKFAPKLIATYHVYGITRRGFGASSHPALTDGNYSADRLGDDVVAVIDALKLNRPVLVGHSIAGEELSSVGSRYPDKVAGLIYLDAGYSYAYYDSSRGDLTLDSLEFRKKLEQLIPGAGPQDQKHLVEELLQTSLPQLEKDLREQQKALQSIPALPQSGGSFSLTFQAVFAGEQKYTNIKVPILAIFAVPHHLSPLFKDDPTARSAAEALDADYSGAQAKAFEIGLPSARVVRLPNADHWVFQSNEADVLHEMNAFLGDLP
jgi:non-heme chloroperoxidase